MISINADGNVFPCFMFMERNEYSLANVNGDGSRYIQPGLAQDTPYYVDKWMNPECQKCWAQSLCFGCSREDIEREGSNCNRSAVAGSSKICDFRRELIKTFLFSVVNEYLKLKGDFISKGDKDDREKEINRL